MCKISRLFDENPEETIAQSWTFLALFSKMHSASMVLNGRDGSDDCWDRSHIPHICHFFYTGRIFENQILHPKKRLKAPKTLKMSLKKSNTCIFFTQSGKIYTWQKIFTQTCLWCLWQIWVMALTLEESLDFPKQFQKAQFLILPISYPEAFMSRCAVIKSTQSSDVWKPV